MPLPRLRYTIDVEGRPKKVVSVSLQQRGDLIIDLKPAESSRRSPSSAILTGSIGSDRSSIHPSPNSPEGNLITRTVPSTHEVQRTVQFTRAIKSTNQFAKVIGRLFPDISYQWPESYAEKDIKLGSFNPRISSLQMALFVGPSEREFQAGQDRYLYGDIRITQNVIGDYRIVILHKTWNLPSLDHGITSFLQTAHPKAITCVSHMQENERIMNGLDEYNAYEEFFREESLFRGERLALVENMKYVQTTIPRKFGDTGNSGTQNSGISGTQY